MTRAKIAFYLTIFNFLLNHILVQKLWATVELLDTENGSRHGREGEGHEEEDKKGDDARLGK